MPDESLIASLRDLGEHLDVPPAADQRAAVRARLAAPSRRRRWRGWLVSAVAALAAAGAVGAIGPARAAVVDAVGSLLGVAGIEVRTSGPSPAALPASPLPSAQSLDLAQARRQARFPLKAPAALGTPEQVEVADPDATGAPRVVTLVYRGGKVRFDQFDGTWNLVFVKQAPDAEWVEVGADTGIWLPTPHPVTYVDRQGVERTATARLAGSTLIWSSGTVTYRLEGFATKEEALTAARSLK